jgi:hypothetical protein
MSTADEAEGELLRLERALASRDPSGIDGGLEALIADDFIERGLSAQRWDSSSTRRVLASAAPIRGFELLDVRVAVVAPDLSIVMYQAPKPRPSNRASVWSRIDGRWQVRYHLAGEPGEVDWPAASRDGFGRLDPSLARWVLDRWQEDRRGA